MAAHRGLYRQMLVNGGRSEEEESIDRGPDFGKKKKEIGDVPPHPTPQIKETQVTDNHSKTSNPSIPTSDPSIDPSMKKNSPTKTSHPSIPAI